MRQTPTVPFTRIPLGPPPFGELDLSPAEVKQLWWFLDGVDGAPSSDHVLAEQLAALTGRINGLLKSFTWQAPPPSPADLASWVEALGSFAGWDYPSRVVGEVL